MWEWILAWLVWLSADPVAASAEHPRAAAAVAAARASMVAGDHAPSPTPADCVCGGTCKNGVWKPDGRVEQRCDCTCERCKNKPGCPDGKCVPKASPASGSTAKPY